VALNLLAIDMGRGGWDVPEALGVVDGSVVDGLAVSDGSVNEAESVEALFTTLFRRQVGCEQFRILGTGEACQRRNKELEMICLHVILGDHVLNRGLDRCRLNGVD
jgi:hypothetical protein